MATTKAVKNEKAEAAAAQLAAICSNPTINLTPVRKEAKTATFTGTMTAFSLMTFPIKTYKATDADGVSFNQVHSCTTTTQVDGKDIVTDNGTVQLKQGSMHCPTCVKNVSKEDILKGFKVGDKFITVTQAEIDAQKPSSDKSMQLTEFVDAMDIDPVFYEATEFIAPDKGGEKPFALLLAGMKATGKVAKGTRVKGGREQTFVVRPYGQNQMAVSYLLADYEVREFSKATAVVIGAQELELATKLIEASTAKFTPAKEDTFLSNVRRMLEAKSAGIEVTVPTVAADPTVTMDLMATLQASLAMAQAAGK